MFKPRRMKRQGQDGKVAPGGSSHSNHLTADRQRFGIPPKQKQKTNNQEDFDSDLVELLFQCNMTHLDHFGTQRLEVLCFFYRSPANQGIELSSHVDSSGSCWKLL